MRKAINNENSSKNVVRVLSIADETIIDNNPTGLNYIIIDDYVEPPVINNPALDINYPMYDKTNKKCFNVGSKRKIWEPKEVRI